MAQLNGSRSMTAAAERAVTFGGCSYRWEARLLSCLGSSAAQGIGGRVIAAPTGGAYLRRAGEDTRPYGGSWKLPLVWAGVRVSRGHPHPALRTPYPFCPFGTFPPDRGNRPSPLEGEGFRAAQCAAPTKYGKLSGLSVWAGSRPDGGRTLCAPTAENGRDRWLGKARRRSGTASVPIFLLLRPPVGPDGTAPKHS